MEYYLPAIPADISVLSNNFADITNAAVIGINNWTAALLFWLAVVSIFLQVCDM
jgi:hypothetical protein